MIDLSADLGEGSPGEDEIWPLITSANVACGGHIGDDALDARSRARSRASTACASARIRRIPIARTSAASR